MNEWGGSSHVAVAVTRYTDDGQCRETYTFTTRDVTTMRLHLCSIVCEDAIEYFSSEGSAQHWVPADPRRKWLYYDKQSRRLQVKPVWRNDLEQLLQLNDLYMRTQDGKHCILSVAMRVYHETEQGYLEHEDCIY